LDVLNKYSSSYVCRSNSCKQKTSLQLDETEQLLVSKETRLKAKRSALEPKPKAKKPNEIWGIDMSKVKTEIGWVYVVVVLDWYSKQQKDRWETRGG
jgi:putative transposase